MSLRGCSADRFAVACPRQGGADELTEQWRRPRRARLELRMELAGNEPRMVRQLDDLDEAAALKRARDHEPCIDELRAVVVVDLVPVPVPLVDDRLAVRLLRARARDQFDG